MGRALGFLLVTVWACAADAPYVPDGKLGFPLGSYLIIEGERAKEGEGQKAGTTRLLMVDTVNGKKLDTPVAVTVETNGALPLTVRIVVRGYETGKMIGVPSEVARHEKHISMPQVGWQFYRSFIITSWVTPEAPIRTRTEPRVSPPPPPGVGAPPPPGTTRSSLDERLEKIRERQRRAAAAATEAAKDAAKQE